MSTDPSTCVFFLLLAVISMYLALTGQASCGCFGRIEINPWFTSGLDFILSFLLGVSWNRNRLRTSTVESFKGVGRIAIGTVVLIFVGLGLFLLIFDDPLATLSRLRGDLITLSPSVANLGNGGQNEWREFSVLATNYSDDEITLVGGLSYCSCITTDSLPVTIKPHSKIKIAVKVRFSGMPGRFSQQFFLFTSHRNAPTLVGHVTGWVLKELPSSTVVPVSVTKKLDGSFP